MKFNFVVVGIIAAISLFFGCVLFANITGVVYPHSYEVVGSYMCDGEMSARTNSYSYRPGETSYSVEAYCVDKENGTKTEMSNRIFLVLGVLFAAPIFLLLSIWGRKLIFATEDSAAIPANGFPASGSTFTLDESPRKGKKKQSALERLTELKKMRDENLISDAEFERKKAEIMEEL